MPLVHSLHAKRAHRARFFVSAAGLEAGARLLQKFGLLRRAGATKYGVAVGEAAKAFDDQLMAAGKIGEAREGGLRRAAGLLGRQRLEQGHAADLLLARFGVLQRQVEEDPRQRRERLVCPQ
jgi:hypothetical protein